MPAPQKAERPTFHSIQMLRGWGALVIVFGHSSLAIKGLTDHYWTYATHDRSWGWADALHAKLYLFVDLFFVASGFIMAMLVKDGGESAPGKFLWRRLSRIYPVYWLFTIPVLLAFLVNPAFNFGQFTGDWSADAQRMGLSMLLWPQEMIPVLGVGWTLVHEMQFYLAIVAVLVLGFARHLTTIMLAMAGLALSLHLSGVSLVNGQFMSLFWVEFALGMVLYHIYPKTSRFAPGWQIAASFGVYALIAVLLDADTDNTFVTAMSPLRVFGVALWGFLLIGGCLGFERHLRSEGPVLTPLRLLGDASYTLYLSHWLVLSMLGKLFARYLPQGLPMITVYSLQVAAMVVCTLFALSFHLVIEKPMNRWLNRLGKAKAPASAKVPVTG